MSDINKGFLRESMHLQQQSASQQLDGLKPLYIGHISSVDGGGALVRVINPSNANDISLPLESGFMPLGSPIVCLPSFNGDNQNPLDETITSWGLQYIPFGGSTPDEPLRGEQVLVCEIDPSIGYSTSAHMIFNTLAVAPGRQIPVDNVQGQSGDYIWVSPSGTVLRFDIKGNLRIYCQQPAGNPANPPAYVNGQPNNDNGNAEVCSNGGISMQTAPRGTQIIPPLQGDIDARAVNNINLEALAGIGLTAGPLTPIPPLPGEILAQSVNDITARAGTNINANAGLNINITALGEINITGLQPVNINSAVQCNVNAPSVNVGFRGSNFYELLTIIFGLWVNTHTHPNGTGGETGPPLNPPVLNDPNTTVSLAAN